jgi:hypothetical protein
VADKNWGAYFHFDNLTFPAGTQVPTFHRELSAEENAALDAANEILAHPGPKLPPVDGEKTHSAQMSANAQRVGAVRRFLRHNGRHER